MKMLEIFELNSGAPDAPFIDSAGHALTARNGLLLSADPDGFIALHLIVFVLQVGSTDSTRQVRGVLSVGGWRMIARLWLIRLRCVRVGQVAGRWFGFGFGFGFAFGFRSDVVFLNFDEFVFAHVE